MFIKASFCSLLVISGLGLYADDHFEAAQVCTMQGQSEAADRYAQMDFTRFVAGNATLFNDNNTDTTVKGFAYFDLEDDDLREELKEKTKDGYSVLLSFVLQQVVGKPRPLRIEYIGTVNDKDSDKSRAQQFQANQISRANNVLEQTSEPGLKVVDVTSLVKHTLKGRWLVLRFEQDGLRIEDGGNDLYQFNPNNSTVRLTFTKDKKKLKGVIDGYHEDGLGGLLPDMQTNILPDMQSDIVPDMSSDLVPDMHKDILPDMNTQNILPDMPQGSIIQDQNNQQ